MMQQQPRSSIVLSRPQLLSDDSYRYVCDKIIINLQNQKLYKTSFHKPITCFIGDYIAPQPLMTITPFDPVFLAIRYVEAKTSLQTAAFFPIQKFIDPAEQDFLIQPVRRICQVQVQEGQQLLMPSLKKILDFLEAKCRRLMNGIAIHSIDTRIGMNVAGEQQYLNQVVESILKDDISEELIKLLATERLNLKTGPRAILTLDSVVNKDREEVHENNNNNQRQKEVFKSKTPTKPSKTKLEQQREAKTNHAITNFFKKKQ